MTLNDESDLHVFCLIDVLDYGSLIFRMVGHIFKMTFYFHKLGIFVCRPDTFLNASCRALGHHNVKSRGDRPHKWNMLNIAFSFWRLTSHICILETLG